MINLTTALQLASALTGIINTPLLILLFKWSWNNKGDIEWLKGKNEGNKEVKNYAN